jgi:hypothetical protein
MRMVHVGGAALCLVCAVIVLGVADGAWVETLGIGLYIISISSTLVLLSASGQQSEMLPRQAPLPPADVSRLRLFLTIVFLLGFAVLVFSGFVRSARTAGFVTLAAISLPLWAYEAALAWRGPVAS